MSESSRDVGAPDRREGPPFPLRRALLGRSLLAAGALVVGPRVLEALARESEIDAAELVHSTAPGGSAPTVITRAQWGADESLRGGPPLFAPITKAIVHHTATLTDEPDPAARVRAIYRYHVQGNGWDDIGYNFVIDREGRIYEGRWARDYATTEAHNGENNDGLGALGAHAYGFNRGSMGVALLGTFTSSDVTASDAAIGALADLLAWKLGPRGIDPHGASGYAKADGSRPSFPNVCGHGDVLATGCPGAGMQRRLAEVRDGIAARLVAAPNAQVSPLSSDVGSQPVDAERLRKKKRKQSP